MDATPFYIMIELGMEVEDMNGYVGVVVGSPRNGKWLILKDDGRAVRLREEYIREYDHERAVRITQDDCPAFQKWLEKRELA